MRLSGRVDPLHNIPLIPANAGVQILKRTGWKAGLSVLRAAAPNDLGPGVRRDERKREGRSLAGVVCA